MRSQRRGRAGDRLLDLCLAGDVTGQQPRLAAIGGDLRDRVLQVRDRAAEHQHVRALGRERPGGGLADAAAAAGDDHAPAGEAPVQSPAASATAGSSSMNPCGRVSLPVRRIPSTVNTTASTRAVAHATVIEVCVTKLVGCSTNVWKKFL